MCRLEKICSSLFSAVSSLSSRKIKEALSKLTGKVQASQGFSFFPSVNDREAVEVLFCLLSLLIRS